VFGRMMAAILASEILLQPNTNPQMSAISKEVFEKYAQEYQEKIADNSKQLAMLRGQLQAKERDRKLCQLTSKELHPFNNETPSYRAVGKMFVKEDLNVLKNTLTKKIDGGSKEIEALQKVALKCDGELKVDGRNVRKHRRTLNRLFRRLLRSSKKCSNVDMANKPVLLVCWL
jgi:prefoldin subunit 1